MQNQSQLKVQLVILLKYWSNVDLSFGRHSQKLCEECKAILHGTFKDQMSHFIQNHYQLLRCAKQKMKRNIRAKTLRVENAVFLQLIVVR